MAEGPSWLASDDEEHGEEAGVGVDSFFEGEGLDSDLTGDPNIGGGGGQNIRFWLPKGTNRIIIFLTDGEKAKVYWEHNFNFNGSWRNWITCLGKDCPMCAFADANAGRFKRYKAVAFTIIDTNEYVNRKGEKKKNEKRLLVAKSETAEIIKKRWNTRRSEGQNLRGAAFDVSRSAADKSASVGTDYEFRQMVDLSALPEALRTELDYAALLKPDPERMKALVKRLSAGGIPSGKKEGPEDGGDGIPF